MSVTPATDRPTGESLLSDPEDYSNIPGANQFFKLEPKDLNLDDYVPTDELPSNPHDYLRSVMIEAQNCPDVVVAKINPQKLQKQTTVKVPAPENLPGREWDPSVEWCEKQIKHFCRARAEYTRHLAHLKSIKRQTKKRPKLPIYPLPSPDDQVNWRYMCLGKNLQPTDSQQTPPADHQLPVEDVGNIDMATPNEADDDLNKATSETGGNGENVASINLDCPNSPIDAEDRIVDLSLLEDGFTPMLRILLRMEAKHVEANLEYHIQWLKTYGFSHQQGRWIYAFLVCLEKPLYPTVISTLRDLARECARLRPTMVSSNNEELLNGLNLIICIVAKYYDQSDLMATS